MKIYIVLEEGYYETFSIVGVFQKKEKATDCIKRYLSRIPNVDLSEFQNDRWSCETWEIRIEEWEVEC